MQGETKIQTNVDTNGINDHLATIVQCNDHTGTAVLSRPKIKKEPAAC